MWHLATWHARGIGVPSFPVNACLVFKLTVNIGVRVEATAVVTEAVAAVLEAAVTACLTLVQVCRSRAGVSRRAAYEKTNKLEFDNHTNLLYDRP